MLFWLSGSALSVLFFQFFSCFQRFEWTWVYDNRSRKRISLTELNCCRCCNFCAQLVWIFSVLCWNLLFVARLRGFRQPVYCCSLTFVRVEKARRSSLLLDPFGSTCYILSASPLWKQNLEANRNNSSLRLLGLQTAVVLYVFCCQRLSVWVYGNMENSLKDLLLLLWVCNAMNFLGFILELALCSPA